MWKRRGWDPPCYVKHNQPEEEDIDCGLKIIEAKYINPIIKGFKASMGTQAADFNTFTFTCKEQMSCLLAFNHDAYMQNGTQKWIP